MVRLSHSDLRIDASSSRLGRPFYTTLDKITGHLIFAPKSPVVVHDVIIDFLGIAKTWVDPQIYGSSRKQKSFQFLKMNDDKNIREAKTASETHPIELPFTFVVPRQLLSVICTCPNSLQNDQHFHLPPSMGSWSRSDDMSADMAKIEYQIRVKIQTKVNGNLSVAAEASEPVQIMPMYMWWQSSRAQLSSESSPAYEGEEVSLQSTSLSGPARTIESQKLLKKGFLGKKKGQVFVSIEIPDSYHINVSDSETASTNSFSMSIKMKYTPISTDLPPNVSSLSARLHARTSYNVDCRKDPRNGGVYGSSVTILRASTPSTSTPLWLEDSASGKPCFVSSLLVPMCLPPAAGTSDARDQKVLLPSFELCTISRSYEIGVKIGFDGGSDVTIRVPVSIVAKPATSVAEAAFENAIRIADNWVPPNQGTEADEVEPELLRPTASNLNLSNPESSDESDTEDAATISESLETAFTADSITNVRLDSPPEYAPAIALVNYKEIIEPRVTVIVA